MNIFLFDRDSYHRLYNCSMLTPEEWDAKKRPSLLGALNLCLSVIYQTLYLPFLIIMTRDHFWQLSCYKLMFMLGVFDVGATVIGGTCCGIFSIKGDIFCTNPTIVYLVGCFQATFWSMSCMTGLVLLFNRSLDLIRKEYAEILFCGRRTYIWFLFPFAVGFYMWFYTTPFLFNSILHASFLSPYIAIPEVQVDIKLYDNEFCAIHNYVVAGLFPILYSFLSVTLFVKMRMPAGSENAGVSQLQKTIIMQSIVVSFILAIISVSYMIMQYFPVPDIAIILSHFFWQASHGASVFTYIFINKSMRKEVVIMIKEVLGKNVVRINPLNPISYHMNPTWLRGRQTLTSSHNTNQERTEVTVNQNVNLEV